MSEQDVRPVPAPLRAAVLRLAADVLGEVEEVQVPASLRAVRRFAPRRRAAAGAGPLWAALHEDDGFRARVTRVWALGDPATAQQLAGDERPSPSWAAAAGAWLQGQDWSVLVPAADPVEPDDDRALESSRRQVEDLRAALGVAREGERLAREELAGLQRELRRLRSDADRARSEARRAGERAAADLEAARAARAEAEALLGRVQDERRASRAEQGAARDAERAGRRLADARVRLLLDTLVDATSGLRHELALPPAAATPAELVAQAQAGDATPARPTSRGRQVDDPALLDDLLRLPHAHLVVDGYNVSKTGWPGLPLADQRRVLVDALARVAALTGAEVTCCFDGQEGHRPPAAQRGVRVLFSTGEIADDLLRRLVAAEPPGRVLVVVTSDQEVVRDVEAAGAWAVPSATLVARAQRS
ncbi:NYN domain-containing protein [Cellulomonas oligotrophica]|uniref:Putative RNA-binding protein with PIN domain n=1 Tax=Cellulomonas oligotrophica TaxID=931536 RepID=A0A7Y9FDJ1_9CELL|nr:NYN domain-containing protein [Cellulomonas oligotrophica]NYD84972.1 putative RNA-binding protein with PIN domain [Cellulomonas oligotrophica]GIG34614.1 hypothetical protein Col01nite_37730 [Cellulomonas oligotrophica]